MFSSWRLFSVFGIEVKIDSSWIIIFALVTWALAGYYFPLQYPDWPRWQYLAVGGATACFLFLSVLGHELTHSLVAKSQKEEVRSITLFIFGGVAEITHEPKTPFREFSMALAGPLASVAFGLFFAGLTRWAEPFSEQVSAASRYLSLINFLLAAFNLIPGFPLDGGRILRAAVWQITRNLKTATRVASVTGQIFSFFLIFLGILEILAGYFINGLWLAFIGWFIHSAAVRGYQQVLLKEMLDTIHARDIMSREFTPVAPDTSIQTLTEDFFLKKRERAFLVMDHGRLEGIVSLHDVKSIPPEERPTLRVQSVMTPKERLAAVRPDDDGNEVLAQLSQHGGVHQVPVLENGQVKGVVRRNDILNFFKLRTELGV